MTVTRWHSINIATTLSKTAPTYTLTMFDLTWELAYCLDILYEILDDLEDIRIGLEKGLDISTFLPPPFDPLRTVGKYQ